MDLSPLLVDTYRRYKRDTKVFTQWLGTTARATGLVDDLLSDQSENPQSRSRRRKKGKNRASQKHTTSHKIPVNALVSLATALKEAKIPSVPRQVLDVLKDIIKDRKGCASWYRAHQVEESSTTKSHNEGHQHVIEILEEVCRILSPLEEKVMMDEPEKATKIVQSTNLYDLLEVEQCPEWKPEESKVLDLPKKTPQDSYDPEPSPEEVSFALYCFMKDMTEIRIFIRRTWREYKHHQITLNSAAITANTAIDIMRRLNESFMESHPEFSEHSMLISYLYNGYVDAQAKGLENLDNESFATYEGDGIRLSSRAFFCDHTAAMVIQFFESGDLPMYQKHLMKGKHFSDEEHYLFQCLSHFNMMDHQTQQPVHNEKIHNVLNDQILRAVHIMRVGKKFPTWAIFACQIFVDTRRELGSHLARGFHDLQQQGLWIRKVWANCLKTSMNNEVNAFHGLNNENMREGLKCLRAMVDGDFVQSMIDEAFEDHPGKSANYNWGEQFLMKNHPLMCGLILQTFLVRGHSFGTRLAADQGPVKAAIYLTNAAAVAGYIPLAAHGQIWTTLWRSMAIRISLLVSDQQRCSTASVECV
jgi:hypothetical protein